MIVAVEGLDGSGKTSIAKYISECYNYDYKKDYLENMLNLSEKEFFLIKDKINDYLEVRTLLFMSSLVYTFQTIKKDTVLDRFILSEYYYDGCIESKEWFEVFVNKTFLPDLTFILYAGDEIRKKRIYKRNKNDNDLNKVNNGEDLYNKMLSFANKYNLNYVLINTNNLNLEQTKRMIDSYMVAFINSYRGEECQKAKKLQYLNNASQ